MSDECVLISHPEFGGCCCVCKWHVPDFSDPHTDGGSSTHQRGWVCVGFLMCEPDGGVLSGWADHGLCELFRQMRPEAKSAQAILLARLAKYDDPAEWAAFVKTLEKV